MITAGLLYDCFCYYISVSISVAMSFGCAAGIQSCILNRDAAFKLPRRLTYPSQRLNDEVEMTRLFSEAADAALHHRYIQRIERTSHGNF